MKKILQLLIAALLLSSCSSGGGAMYVSGAKVQYFWPTTGHDRFEAVVYPAER